MYPWFGLLHTIHYFIIFCKTVETRTAYAASSFLARLRLRTPVWCSLILTSVIFVNETKTKIGKNGKIMNSFTKTKTKTKKSKTKTGGTAATACLKHACRCLDSERMMMIMMTDDDGWMIYSHLPVHRDKLRAQRSVTSMGSLYLYHSIHTRVVVYTSV